MRDHDSIDPVLGVLRVVGRGPWVALAIADHATRHTRDRPALYCRADGLKCLCLKRFPHLTLLSLTIIPHPSVPQMAFPAKLRAALGACFGVGMQSRQSIEVRWILVVSVICCCDTRCHRLFDDVVVIDALLRIGVHNAPTQVRRPVKEVDHAHGADDGIKAVHSVACGTQTECARATDEEAERLGTW